jgi:hypothetical protein
MGIHQAGQKSLSLRSKLQADTPAVGVLLAANNQAGCSQTIYETDGAVVFN